MKVKDIIPASKPRNFVAKNQKTAGAGAHKDKKKAEKQGDVKHKGKQYDEAVAEGYGRYWCSTDKKWKVFQGRGTYADDYREKAHYQQLKDWARKKSEATGKKWEVYITGEAPTA